MSFSPGGWFLMTEGLIPSFILFEKLQLVLGLPTREHSFYWVYMLFKAVF